MIIFESLLTTFEGSVIFLGRLGGNENRLEPKTLSPKPLIVGDPKKQ